MNPVLLRYKQIVRNTIRILYGNSIDMIYRYHFCHKSGIFPDPLLISQFHSLALYCLAFYSIAQHCLPLTSLSISIACIVEYYHFYAAWRLSSLFSLLAQILNVKNYWKIGQFRLFFNNLNPQHPLRISIDEMLQQLLMNYRFKPHAWVDDLEPGLCLQKHQQAKSLQFAFDKLEYSHQTSQVLILPYSLTLQG